MRILDTMNTEERRAWGPLIRAAREAQGIKQEDLADMANTSRRTIGSIERGDTTAQTEVLKRVLAALGLAPEQDMPSDVRSFLAMLGPLLSRVDAELRESLMPGIVDLTAEAIRQSAAASGQAGRHTVVVEMRGALGRKKRSYSSFDPIDLSARNEDRERPQLGDE